MNALDSCKKRSFRPDWWKEAILVDHSYTPEPTARERENFLFYFERGRSITSVVFCGTGLFRNKKETGVRGVHVFLCHHQLLVAMLSVPKTDKYTKDETPPPPFLKMWCVCVETVPKNVVLALSILTPGVYSRLVLCLPSLTLPISYIYI